jgi:uncharacterized protein CbrC (UPF0167 family)
LGIGCTVTVECPECGAENGLDADDRADGACCRCGHTVRFPDVEDGPVTICYSCLRSGKGAITIDTEFGMIGWAEAIDGATHGVPGLDRNDVELIPRDDGWVAARLPQEWMFELVRTPTYISIQGERWQFCCGRPMVYVGVWTCRQFTERADDGDGRRLFEKTVQDAVPGLWEQRLHDVTGVYVFRCPSCTRLTAHWDIA